MIKVGQTVIISHYDSTDLDERNLIGTEEAEVIGTYRLQRIKDGIVIVRPFGSNDHIDVHIRDINAVA